MTKILKIKIKLYFIFILTETTFRSGSEGYELGCINVEEKKWEYRIPYYSKEIGLKEFEIESKKRFK